MNTLDEQTAQEYARWFYCLAEPTRIRILNTVASATKPLTVGEIVDAVGKSQATVSRHLKLLAETRYVFLEPEGVRTFVSINKSCMAALPEAAALIMATDNAFVAP